MAKRYEYIVYERQESGRVVTIAPSAVDNAPCERWTHALAGRWVHEKNHKGPRTIFVDRRLVGSKAPYMEHRVYAVDADGNVRRTDG